MTALKTAVPKIDVYDVPAMCRELQRLRKPHRWFSKSRIMNENRLRATVANSLGYYTTNTETMTKAAKAALKGLNKVAGATIKDMVKMFDRCEGCNSLSLSPGDATTLARKVQIGHQVVEMFRKQEEELEKSMIHIASRLPVAGWVQSVGQHGFGIGNLAVIIGEAGDLTNLGNPDGPGYTNPGKLWKRMGCGPFTKGNQTRMGKTWKSAKGKEKLSTKDWEAFGYCPRRRSVAYILGISLRNGNGEKPATAKGPAKPLGPYRARYDEVKASAPEKHPEWTKGHVDYHALLLMEKLALKNLWIEWNRLAGTLPAEQRHWEETAAHALAY